MSTVAPPLPDSWSAPEVLLDAVVADGVELRRAGISSIGPIGEEIVGAAVEAEGSPYERGYFELLERVSTVEFLHGEASSHRLRDLDGGELEECTTAEIFPTSVEPTKWRYARSNGVALHSTWKSAALRALWELVERDRVLRAWYGETRPQRLQCDFGKTPLAHAQSYAWRAYLFPAGTTPIVNTLSVVGVFGLPSSDDLPVVSGYGAQPERGEALTGAVREALQQLGFLWGEAVVDTLPDLAPTPLAHLERYQWPGNRRALRKWLEKGHQRYFVPRDVGLSKAAPCHFVDLTPAWLGEGLRVVKAVCDDALPLVFGENPLANHLPTEIRFHPIG